MKALITGISGQDGSYLCELLLSKGYEVYGLDRRKGIESFPRIDKKVLERLHIVEGDLLDFERLRQIVKEVMPDEIYNLAAQSHVGYSFKAPISTFEMSGKAVLFFLEIIREVNSASADVPKIKFYQASTSELFGGDPGTEPQSETTPFNPHSPYAIAKLSGFHFVKLYREAYKIFACNGILFNHESPRRGADFVTRKVTLALANIKAGRQEFLELGNMDAKRDWGFAGDYVEGMWRILQNDTPDDFVLATGETHTVREFVEEAGKLLGYDVVWEGKAEKEIGKDKKTGKIIVKINPEFYRPGEVNLLLGDPAKAKKVLGWTAKTSFKELVKMMVEADVESIK
ncbi:GDP-mannose 4,6-dehydratase [Candidatus Microgenomates bacterium]|nr:GDP-mannose 4,6-dehydratase [Candidatus Microgenomates bacterium]